MWLRRPVDRDPAVPAIAIAWAERFAAFDEVEAVALGGSWRTGSADDRSDVDLEVYCRTTPSMEARRRLIEPGALRTEVGNEFFGPGDEWVYGDRQVVDVAYWTPAFIEGQLDRVLVRHEPSLGYSTAFWATARDSRALFDRSGWFAAMQERARSPYPEPLRRAIVAHNHPMLRAKLHSYRDQIAAAVQRDDAVSVQHRSAALLASWFDIVFALDRVLHPGEKRQVALMRRWCPSRPAGAEEQVGALVAASGAADPLVLRRVDALLDALDDRLRAEALLPA